MNSSPLKFDLIGDWSEIKLDIVKAYAKAYSTILAAQNRFRTFILMLLRVQEFISRKNGAN